MSGRHKRNEMSSIDILYVGGKYEANEMTCEDAVAHVLEMTSALRKLNTSMACNHTCFLEDN